MSYNMHDFDNLTDLQLYILPKNNIILVNRSLILSDSISKVWFNFEVSGWSEQIFLIGVRYCAWLDTKLISLGILNRKSLMYFAQQGLLTVKDQDTIIITSQLNQHNLYCVNLSTNASLSNAINFYYDCHYLTIFYNYCYLALPLYKIKPDQPKALFCSDF